MPISCRRLEDVIAVSATGARYRIERHLVQQPDANPDAEPHTVLTCRLSTGGEVVEESAGVYRLESGEVIRAVDRRRKKNVPEE